MRISDWSADVCSSDLTALRVEHLGPGEAAEEVEDPAGGLQGGEDHYPDAAHGRADGDLGARGHDSICGVERPGLLAQYVPDPVRAGGGQPELGPGWEREGREGPVGRTARGVSDRSIY